MKVTDVQVNGTSVVTNGVANVPVATNAKLGVAMFQPDYGLTMYQGVACINAASSDNIKNGTNYLRAITASKQHESAFFGLSKAAGYDLKNISGVTAGTYPEESKSAISQMLNAPVTISGTTPSITAKPGVRYVCGECSTLDISAPASGCIDVTFVSGSTPTVLTITPPTGRTIKWANGFDPSSLDANTTYEVNILDGEFGVVGSWT